MGNIKIGDSVSSLLSLGDVRRFWNSGVCDEGGRVLSGVYLFGDVDFHCQLDQVGEMRIYMIAVRPGFERGGVTRSGEFFSEGLFSFRSHGIVSEQLGRDVLPKLSQYGVRFNDSASSKYTLVYDVGDYATAIFHKDEGEAEERFYQFEVS